MRTRHTQSNLPPHFTAADLPVALRFGPYRAILRPLDAGDVSALLAFFASHSEDTLYRRYGYVGVQMTPEKAARLVNVDRSRDAALGVFEESGGELRLIAIGRYCLGTDGRWAEVAFVVHEQRRGIGIGATLFAALQAIARERGLERLVAQVQHDNAPMLQLLRAAGATTSPIGGSSSLNATVWLRSPIAPSSPPKQGGKKAMEKNFAATPGRASAARAVDAVRKSRWSLL